MLSLCNPNGYPARHILNTTGVPTDCLQLEITENLAAEDEQIQLQLHEGVEPTREYIDLR